MERNMDTDMWPVLVLMLTIFNHPRTNLFVWQTFLQEKKIKKILPIIASVFSFFHKKVCQIKSVCPRMTKHQYKDKPHIHEKSHDATTSMEDSVTVPDTASYIRG
jgi:hypothetical protein